MLNEVMAVLALLAAEGLTPAEQLDARQVRCLADNVYHEARGEPLLGQMAVAQVTVNRLNPPAPTRRQPNSICAVVYAPRQFSWTHQRIAAPVAGPAYHQAVRVAAQAMLGMSPAVLRAPEGGAPYLFFYNPQVARRQPWAVNPARTRQIGNHIFLALN